METSTLYGEKIAQWNNENVMVVTDKNGAVYYMMKADVANELADVMRTATPEKKGLLWPEAHICLNSKQLILEPGQSYTLATGGYKVFMIANGNSGLINIVLLGWFHPVILGHDSDLQNQYSVSKLCVYKKDNKYVIENNMVIARTLVISQL